MSVFNSRSEALHVSTTGHRSYATLSQFIPVNRMATVAKTPLLIAFGMYVAGGGFETRTVGITMMLAALLWAALYVLNESSDVSCEQNKVVQWHTQVLLFMLPVAFCIASAYVSRDLFLLFALMAIGQIAYCIPPLRLKRYWWAAPLLSGGINPVLRLQCGAIWGAHSVPIIAYAVLVSLHLSSAIRTRNLQRDRDKRLGYLTAPSASEKVGAVCMALGLLGACYLCLQHVLPLYFVIPAAVAVGFCWYAWSNRVTDVEQLRRGWILFALLTPFAVIALFCLR